MPERQLFTCHLCQGRFTWNGLDTHRCPGDGGRTIADHAAAEIAEAAVPPAPTPGEAFAMLVAGATGPGGAPINRGKSRGPGRSCVTGGPDAADMVLAAGRADPAFAIPEAVADTPRGEPIDDDAAFHARCEREEQDAIRDMTPGERAARFTHVPGLTVGDALAFKTSVGAPAHPDTTDGPHSDRTAVDTAAHALLEVLASYDVADALECAGHANASDALIVATSGLQRALKGDAA